MEKDGFYSIAYTGLGGSGFGMVTLTKGIIVGADAAGGIWDGTYSFDPAAAGLVANLQVTLPPNVVSALTGGRSIPGANVQKFSAVLPIDLGGEKAITVKTSLGLAINVVLRKVRGHRAQGEEVINKSDRILTQLNHDKLDDLLGRVLDAYRDGSLTKSDAVAGFMHVVAAIDIRNRTEIESWCGQQGVEFFTQP